MKLSKEDLEGENQNNRNKTKRTGNKLVEVCEGCGEESLREDSDSSDKETSEKHEDVLTVAELVTEGDSEEEADDNSLNDIDASKLITMTRSGIVTWSSSKYIFLNVTNKAKSLNFTIKLLHFSFN